MSINRAIICGHLGRDAEAKSFGDGRQVVNLSVATTEKWRDKQSGEMREATEWHRVAIFGPAAEYAGDLRKGDKVTVIGSIKTRSWDQDGTTRYSTEIVVTSPADRVERLGAPSGGSSGAAYQSSRQPAASSGRASTTKAKAGKQDDFDDEIPF